MQKINDFLARVPELWKQFLDSEFVDGAIEALPFIISIAWVITWVVLVLTVIYGPLLLTKVLGMKRWFFTLNKEATAQNIEDSDGFQRSIMAMQGHQFRYKTKEYRLMLKKIRETSTGEKKDRAVRWDIVPASPVGSFHRFTRRLYPLGGLRWLGIPGISKVCATEDGTDCLPLDWEVLEFTYEDAKMKGGFPVNVHFAMRRRILNPYKAQYRSTNWREDSKTLAIVESIDELGEISYKDYYQKTRKWRTAVNKMKEVSNETIKKEFGVEVAAVRIMKIVPTKPELELLALKLWTADQEALATVRTAKATATATEKVADGDAKAYGLRLKAWMGGGEISQEDRLRLRELDVAEGLENLTVFSPGVGITPMLPIKPGGTSTTTEGATR